ncbi:pantetheine-phosphate adenylyltransferase family protein [Seiridium cupressi]
MKDRMTPSLLLLPPPPHPANRAALNAAYRPSLRSVVSRLKQLNHPAGAVLIIAVAVPVLKGPFRRQKALHWSTAQSLLAGLYSILSVVCAELQVATVVAGGQGSVDARVVLVDHDLAKRPALDFKPAIETNNTAVVDLGTFVSAYHPWNHIFSVDTEAGHQLLSTYLNLLEGIQSLKQEQIITVEGGLTMHISSSTLPESTTPSSNVVCLGGTFDHLHPGHKLLLTAGALLLNVPTDGSSKPCKFIIGITGDELLKNKKYAEFVQSWDDRAMYVIEFLSSILALQLEGWKKESTPKLHKKDGEVSALFRDDTILIECVVIQDAFGPTITVEAMDALIVSGETRSGGAAVNDKRKSLGWHPMEVFEVDVLDTEDISDETAKTRDFATKISSTAIRKQKAESRI